MILTICYNDSCESFENVLHQLIEENFSNITVISYNESFYDEKKKAFKIIGGYSARMTPFVLLTEDDKKYIKVFYSEDNSCTIDNIIKFIKSINNESTSN